MFTIRKPVEHGNVISSTILFTATLINGFLSHKLIIAIIAWIPIILGLFLYDVPIKIIGRDRRDYLLILFIAIIAFYSLIVDWLLIIPYAIFAITYSTRIYLSARRLNFITVIMGLVGYGVIFSILAYPKNISVEMLTIITSSFLIGSEFSVRYFLKKNPIYLLYNIYPPLLIFLNSKALGLILTLIRIPLTLWAKKIKFIGIGESILLSIFIFLIELYLIF